MSETAEKIIDEVLKLDADERTALIVRILDTMGDKEQEIDALWRTEVRQRIAAIECGKRRLSSWDEAQQRIFAR